MDQRVSFITLVVTDLDATRRFYVDGLGWEAEIDVPGEVLMFRVAEKVVLTLAHNLATPQGVDTVLAQARAAGASDVGEGASASGAATAATSPIPTASGGRSPSTPATSGSRCSRDR